MRTAHFQFKFGWVGDGHKMTGNIKYEWINDYGADRDGNRGERELIIHSVTFDHIDDADVKKLANPDLYNYLVDRAKEACYFE